MYPDFSIFSVGLISVQEQDKHIGKQIYKFKAETKVNQG